MNRKPRQYRRAYWLRHMQRWHWISAALCLLGMLLFAVTGITLNHAAGIEARPQVATREGTLPSELLALVSAGPATGRQPLPARVGEWLSRQMAVETAGGEAEWSDKEVYLALPRPGGDAWLTIDRTDGTLHYERTDRGWIAYFNDLHKGRHTGLAWSLFIDLFAIACIVFSVTGVLLLKLHAANRPATWPVVGLGLLIPVLLILLFIH